MGISQGECPGDTLVLRTRFRLASMEPAIIPLIGVFGPGEPEAELQPWPSVPWSLSGAGGVSMSQRGQCVVFLEVNKFTSAQLYLKLLVEILFKAQNLYLMFY